MRLLLIGLAAGSMFFTCGEANDLPARQGQNQYATSPTTTDTLPEWTFPDTDWARAEPAELGVDPVGLDSVLAYLERHTKEDGLEETLVVRRGYLLWAGDSIGKAHNIYSCTKSFVSTAVGLMAEEGLLDLDDRVAEDEPLLAEYYPDVTYRHFLTMTSGYDARGENRWEENSEDWSWTPFEPAPPLFAPGTAYAYWDEAMIMLGRALTRVAGTSLENYVYELIAEPIGMENFGWWFEEALEDGNPINFGGTGIDISASDHARFGLLFANNGMWEDRRLLPHRWAELAGSNQVPETIALADTDRRATDGRGIYGFNWWVINAEPDGAPVHAYYTSGLRHNVCLVIPEWEMVIVRMGEDGNPEAGKHTVYTELLRRLAPAIRN